MASDLPEDEVEQDKEEVARYLHGKNSAQEPKEDKEVAKSRSTDSSTGAKNEETSQAVEAQSDVLDTRGKQKRKRVYQFSGEDDFDSDMDSTYIPQAAEHDDSSDSTILRKKVKSKYEKTEKKTWSVEEKLLLKPLIQISLRSGKPPVKGDVTLLQRRYTALASLPWVKIKHQIWAIAQAEKNKTKKIMKALKL